MRPILFLLGFFGLIYTGYSYFTDRSGTEAGFIASIAYSVYKFARIFIHPPNPLSYGDFYFYTIVFFALVFTGMIITGLKGSTRKG